MIEEVEALVAKPIENWESNCTVAVDHLIAIAWSRPGGSVGHWMALTRDSQRKEMMEALEGENVGKGELLSRLGEAWTRGRHRALDRLARYEDGSMAAKIHRRAVLDKRIPRECPWELVEVAGYNPRSKILPEKPHPDVWPREVAKRLNRDQGENFYERGWTEDSYSGDLVKRDGRPPAPRNLPPLTMPEQSVERGPEPRRHELPVTEPVRQAEERDLDFGPSR